MDSSKNVDSSENIREHRGLIGERRGLVGAIGGDVENVGERWRTLLEQSAMTWEKEQSATTCGVAAVVGHGAVRSRGTMS